MSSYTRNQIKEFGIKGIKEIIPLDDESLSQMVDYTITSFNSRDAVSQHLINLLGESPDSLDFIAQFCNMLFGDPAKANRVPQKSPPPPPEVVAKKQAPKVLKVLPSGPGGRSKIVATKIKSTSNPWDANNENKKVAESKQRLTNNKKGATTSELLDLKPTEAKKVDFNKKNAQKKLDNLKDLDSALMELEIKNDNGLNQSGDSEKIRRVCNCNATRHPLFEMFPNCLNCGKIICIKEGLQPCSFCGKDLLKNEERLQILEILRREKEELDGSKSKTTYSTSSIPTNKKKTKVTISVNSKGENNFKVQEQFFKKIEEKRKLEREKEQKLEEDKMEIEKVQKELDYYSTIKGKDDDLIKAQEKLDTLLNFQDNSAQRTKIIDQASDFENPSNSSVNLWATPLERALQLKRQQKLLRKQENLEKQRTGRGKKVIDMSIKNGKVYLREVSTVEDDNESKLSDDEDIKGLEEELNKEKLSKFNENSKKVWEFEKDGLKWERPVYIGTEQNGVDSEDEELNKLPVLGSVVQFGDEEEQENALFSMVGV